MEKLPTSRLLRPNRAINLFRMENSIITARIERSNLHGKFTLAEMRSLVAESKARPAIAAAPAKVATPRLDGWKRQLEFIS